GNSVTNCVEELSFQVCERFEIPADRLVWLEHYDQYNQGADWNLITFAKRPPDNPFEGPRWTKMTPDHWRDLQLKPKSKLTRRFGQYRSKITKLFDWPV